jgi:preprotein translocase subunit SecD
MKTILYSLIAIIIFGIIASGFINKVNNNNIILIQSIDNDVSSVSLTQSVKIISNRLRDFSSEKFDVTIIPEKNQIQVKFTNTWDLKTAENLLTKKGTMEFYETYNHKNLVELLNGDKHLFSLLNGVDAKNSPIKVGCIPVSEVGKVNDYLNTLGLNQKCKFAWTQYFDNSDICLYVLKIDGKKGALIEGTDIESVKFKQDTASKENEIEIIIKKSAITLWSNATKCNIGKAIAIVLDNNVISSPIVRSEIDGGHSLITGDFTETQAKYIAALGNNGVLPLSFKILK